MTAWLNMQRTQGKIIEEFTIESAPYNLRGYSGSLVYIYVFDQNIF